jgi:hypothetical protein
MWQLHDPTNDPEYRFAAQIERRVDDLVRRSSVQIFAADFGALRKAGRIFVVEAPPITGIASGTLFRVGDKHFIVTAAHVVTSFRVEGRQLRIGLDSPKRPQPVAAADQDVAIDTRGDVAVIRLQSDVIARLANPRFLELSDIAFDAEIKDWRCVLFGYLWEGTQPGKDYAQLLVHNYKHWTKAYGGSVAAESFDESIHVLVEYDKYCWSVPDGVPKQSPKSLGGLSGSSLWRIFTPQHIEEGWCEQAAKVVAVENLVYDGRIIRCTRWNLVPPLIASLEPSVEPLLQGHTRDDGT